MAKEATDALTAFGQVSGAGEDLAGDEQPVTGGGLVAEIAKSGEPPGDGGGRGEVAGLGSQEGADGVELEALGWVVGAGGGPDGGPVVGAAGAIGIVEGELDLGQAHTGVGSHSPCTDLAGILLGGEEQVTRFVPASLLLVMTASE